MKPAVLVKCPNCQNTLRVPPDAVDVALKCKHCGYILQIKKKPASAKAAAPGPAPAAKTAEQPRPIATMQAPALNDWSPEPNALDELPEYTPLPPAAPPPPAYQQAPLTAPLPLDDAPAAAPSDYNPAFERAGRRHTGRGSYKGPRGSGTAIKLIVVGCIVVAGAGVFATVLLKPEWFKSQQPDGGQAKNDDKQDPNNPNAKTDQPGTRPPAIGPLGPFPRRIMAISLSDYLYANPTRYGFNRAEKEGERRDFYKVIDRLAGSWKVPKDQVFFVTDGSVENNKVDRKHPPLKMVITGAIAKFLATSRAQDRIVLIFAGHAVEMEGEAYLVPLEGELDDPVSLIPLKDIFAQLAKCPAQEKLVIFDVCRYDPGRGFERPALKEGMTEGLEKALHNSPDGVSVWTSCSAGQFSYEYEYSQVEMSGLPKFEMYGSIFLNMFVAMQLRNIPKRMKAASAGITSPADPLPLDAVGEYVNEFTNKVVEYLENKDQKPKLTLKSRTQWLTYDPTEALASRFELPLPPPTAKREEVVAMFRELNLPNIKAIRKDDVKDQALADSFPFTEEALKGYFDDGPSFEDIQKAPEKFMKDYPLRVATVAALVEMRKLRQENVQEELPDEFRSPINEALKKTITDKYQRLITDRQSILQEQMEALEQVARKKAAIQNASALLGSGIVQTVYGEKSKRWLASYEYAYAQARIRLAYIYEYNLALGKVKTDALPELGKNQIGWKLATADKMISGKEIRDLADEGKNSLSEIVKEHPNTPWAVMAKTQRHMELGLRWQASSFGVEP